MLCVFHVVTVEYQSCTFGCLACGSFDVAILIPFKLAKLHAMAGDTYARFRTYLAYNGIEQVLRALPAET